MSYRPIAPLLPLGSWAVADQEAWQRRPTSWNRKYSAQISREYGRLLSWLPSSSRLHASLDGETLITYANWLKLLGEERYGLHRLRLLTHALLVVRPDCGVASLQQSINLWAEDYAERRRGRPARRGNWHSHRAGLGLRVRDWPEIVRARWDGAAGAGGKYVGGGALSDYRPESLVSLRDAYCLWLGFLHRGDHDVDVTPNDDLVDAFAYEQERRVSPGTAASTLGRTCRVLSALYPGFAGTRFRYQKRRLGGREGSGQSKLSRLVHPSALAAAGERLIERARISLRGLRAALDFRDGLLLMLLAYRPARIGNVAAIRLGVELDLNTPMGRLVWTPAQTKNKIALSLELNAELVALIREYLEQFRPLLARDSSAGLWLGRYGRPLSIQGLQLIIASRTEELLGKRVPPHLFRDCLATMIAMERPERIDDVQALLGHQAAHSKDRYISLARSIVAQRRREGFQSNARKACGRATRRFRSR